MAANSFANGWRAGIPAACQGPGAAHLRQRWQHQSFRSGQTLKSQSSRCWESMGHRPSRSAPLLSPRAGAFCLVSGVAREHAAQKSAPTLVTTAHGTLASALCKPLFSGILAPQVLPAWVVSRCFHVFPSFFPSSSLFSLSLLPPSYPRQTLTAGESVWYQALCQWELEVPIGVCGLTGWCGGWGASCQQR